MSVTYEPVLWNRQKLVYDIILIGSVVLYLLLFMHFAESIGSNLAVSNLDVRGIRIRAFGSAGFILLHVILSIGPLSRLNRNFLPLLYNRRHMGVTMFTLALWHAHLATGWYHDFGNIDMPLVSLLVSNVSFFTVFRFPFEILGFAALCILLLMAATSHDFWLANLTAPIWKGLHMLVYAAYALLVGHVVLGALQTNRHPGLILVVALGLVWIVTIHLLSALKEAKLDQAIAFSDEAEFVEVGHVDEIPNNQAKIVCLSGERVAIFKYDGKVSAVSNVCQHQNGPLGEGRIIDGCITCPWHGYQYQPGDGASPPPFTEKIPTFAVKLEGDRIFINPIPKRPGTPVEPAIIA